MSIALEWGYDKNTQSPSKGFVYFDVVTSYQKNNSGAVSSHPISSGSLISDHFTKNNKVLNLDTFISGADIWSSLHIIKNTHGDKPINGRDTAVKEVTINQDKHFSQFLPDSIGQFFTPKTPEIALTPANRQDYKEVANLLERLFEDGQMTFVNLIEYDGVTIKTETKNLVLTTLSFNEDADSGDGLYCNISLEQVSIVSSKSVELPADVKEKYQKLAALNNKVSVSSDKTIGTAETSPKESPIPKGDLFYPYSSPFNYNVINRPLDATGGVL